MNKLPSTIIPTIGLDQIKPKVYPTITAILAELVKHGDSHNIDSTEPDTPSGLHLYTRIQSFAGDGHAQGFID